jgi:hypothetical protein
MASSNALGREHPTRTGHPTLLIFAAVALNLLALFNGLDAMAAITGSREAPVPGNPNVEDERG